MKKLNLPFTGAATALVTPFNHDQSVDYGSLSRLIDTQIDAGIHGLLLLGTTGESSTLTGAEKREIVRFATEEINGRVPLIVGTGSNDTRRAVDFTRYASENGADAVLVVTPYYNKTTDAGLVRHFSTIADASSKPVILYNIPARTGMNIPLHVYKELSSHGNIVGVKEASGNIGAICELISSVGDRLAVYAGNDSEIVPVMASGGGGVFSVLSNIMPREIVLLTSLMQNGDYKSASELSHKLSAITKALFSEVNPIPVKAACEMLGICSSVTRPPLCEIGEGARTKLREELIKLNLTQK